jgi:hypothetical protein
MQEYEDIPMALMPVDSTHDCTFFLPILQYNSYTNYLNNFVCKDFLLDMKIPAASIQRRTILTKLKEEYYPNTKFRVNFFLDEETVVIPIDITFDMYIDYGLPISEFTIISVVIEDDTEMMNAEEVKVNDEDPVELSTNNENPTEMEPFLNFCTKSVRKTRRWNFKVKEVEEKVESWRKYMKNGDSAKEAAKKVGVPSKTLTDFHNLVKHAKECEFNFEANADKHIGVLRRLRDGRKRIKKGEKVFIIEKCYDL